ncbi:FAD:protein FMN transferase [Sedimentitalea nanhaiensis]|uniref:FAD:protein FMN transferase n=1 Tax=Sedimentitalea nanhaiensis TaxID=999627 RepID=A0A1I7EAW4_9RHOB|nr:FAD:protein FMN transferase [Sedimentitalea nanhaiensis]SFU21074.1 thiamine biosynthesis lipoprotein [Sedimentitalea nanhaiensis]
MLKIPIDLVRHALNGPTMGTRWSALFYAPAAIDPEPIRAALAESVDAVDRQMSTWKPESDLMRLNGAPVGTWVSIPSELMTVLEKGLEIGRLSNGAFDIGMGDVVSAWGFGPNEVSTQAIHATLGKERSLAHELLELDLDALSVRKLAPLALDLSGIAKGFAVDQMMAVLNRFEITDALVGLDGEMRGSGVRLDGRAWTVAIERPDYETRAPLSMIELTDAAVATSGDYRHWIETGGKRLSHTMDPALGGPLQDTPASVTVLAKTCMQADAWATAFMVSGQEKSAIWAKDLGLTAVFVHRDGDEVCQLHIGMPI